MRIFAKILALLWGAWWAFFGIACGISEGSHVTAILLHGVLPGMVFLASALIALKWEKIGGVLLVLAGLATLIVFPPNFEVALITTLMGNWMMLAILPLPGVLSGVILLITGRKASLSSIKTNVE